MGRQTRAQSERAHTHQAAAEPRLRQSPPRAPAGILLSPSAETKGLPAKHVLSDLGQPLRRQCVICERRRVTQSRPPAREDRRLRADPPSPDRRAPRANNATGPVISESRFPFRRPATASLSGATCPWAKTALSPRDHAEEGHMEVAVGSSARTDS